jgi:hypothetical protein
MALPKSWQCLLSIALFKPSWQSQTLPKAAEDPEVATLARRCDVGFRDRSGCEIVLGAPGFDKIRSANAVTLRTANHPNRKIHLGDDRENRRA